MPHNSTDCIWKGLQPANDHSMVNGGWSFKVTDVAAIWYAIYYFLLIFHCKYICILHRFRDIDTYLTLTTPIWEKVCQHKTNISRANLCTKFDDSIFCHSRDIQGGVKFWNGSRDPSHAPFRDGRSSVRRLTLDIACKHTKFDDTSFSRSTDISWGVKFQNWSRDPDHAHLGDSWPNSAQNLKSVALAVPEISHEV